ncbi:aminopeptidase P family protein [Alloacidobacterium dinghuense]|uniref:Aminopeptidase P family protein n=1 Tax=Alloacidobacterium dinghuense TaxID=2763107 RepID=A0A7G8BII5_9BACT|nr:M24 family metallopeptidase [Alloacidobacterium dinghuense]QNI32355.1 aminopeptidase P family protein [Alloacidobacterium dinghuense]
MNLLEIQSALRDLKLDAWLFYDHHHRDPIGEHILGLDPHAHITRRWYYVIPAQGEPHKLVHRIEQARLDSLPGGKTRYSSWQELQSGLETMLAPYHRIAMQYSPRNAIMYVAMVDAGTVELLREMGKTIVSSADLVSQFEAVLSEEQIASHYEAQQALDEILAEGFRAIDRRLKSGITEYEMMTWFQQAIERAEMVTENGPNVSVNENSSDSHYEPTAAHSRKIQSGDFLLIDIWARKNRPGTCWYDITWTGLVGREPSERENHVFQTVKNARDAAIRIVQDAFAQKKPIAGWQADDAARGVIREAGLESFFTHRTGHNIGTEIHGGGAHLDNLETHDERRILPFTCFSVEPGVYLPEFGIRSEINMITSRDKAEVTGRIQQELVRI